MAQDAFDLKATIAGWRCQMIAGGITKTIDLDELESHFLEDMDKLVASGMTGSEAFATATQRIGRTALIRNEFKKVESQRKYRAAEFIMFVSILVSALTTTEKSDVITRFLLGIILVSYVQFALIRSGILNRARLIRIRPYALVANFIFAALLTNPRIIIQVLMALVLQLLFEVDVRNTGVRERQLDAAHQ